MLQNKGLIRKLNLCSLFSRRQTRAVDMRRVLMSLDAEWVGYVFGGMKQWEYRKQPPGILPPYKWVIYANQPVGKVVGDVVIDRELRDNSFVVTQMTIDDTPHSAEFVREYFGDRREWCALHIDQDSLNRYEEPLELDRHPPQNFQYLNEGELAV